jgi:hypothetical protein
VLAVTSVLGLRVSNDTAVGAIAARAGAGTERNDYSDSVTYRVDLASTSRGVLGSDWLSGLGFLDPDYRYFTDLPNGSIRSSDIGFFNVLMTMGIVGLVFIYAMPGVALMRLLRHRHRHEEQERLEWVQAGTVTWLISTLISSITLVTLFSVPGLIVTAAMLTIGLNSLPTAVASEESHRLELADT